LDGSLLFIVTGGNRKSLVLLPVAAASGHPLTPFVVGEHRSGDNEDSENAEENLHGESRETEISCQDASLSR
jgi:hypothetical protein